MTNLQEILMFYLKNDVILLTENFQNYIDTCKKAYSCNALYSYGTPTFTRKADLKYNGVELDHITHDKLRI